MAQDSNLCSNCRNPLSFTPRVNVNLHLNPSISSSLEMRQIISLCDEDLDDYDTEIIRLQNQIIHLQAQKKRLSNYKTQLRSFFSLFRQLPNEILCIIFESTCAENLLQEYPWPPGLDKLPPITDYFSLPAITYLPALVISAVCTRWRSLALASPRLWSQLRLETGPSEKALGSGFVSTLRLYLNRSVDAPLSIDVVAQGRNYLFPALNLLFDHADRWRTFSYTGDYDLAELIGSDLSFPILENLTLQGYQGTWNLKLFEDVPKLLTVVTDGRITDLPRSWSHLTSLQMLRPPNEEEMDALQRYPDLMHLTVSSPYYGFGTGIASLARLESFTLVEFPFEQKETLLSDMFSTMTLPSLTELVIDSRNYQPRLFWQPDAFWSFISRSACTLTTLSLRLVIISDQFLITAFHILPSLVNFCIDDRWEDPDPTFVLFDSPLTKHFILSMSASSRTPVLPKLHTLSITAYNPLFDDAAFVDMVSSRWLPGPSAAAKGIDCLRSLVLHLPTREVDEEIYRPLENLDRMGMRVVVTGKRVTGTNTS